MLSKRFTIFGLLVISFGSFLSTSCKSDNISLPDPYKVNKDSLVAMINGVKYASYDDNAVGHHDKTVHCWTIAGYQSLDSASSLVLFLYDTFAIGQPVTTTLSTVQYTPNVRAIYFDRVGVSNTTVTVTSVDSVRHVITGTFSGNLTGSAYDYAGGKIPTDTSFVTCGKFSVYYDTTGTTIPPGNTAR